MTLFACLLAAALGQAPAPPPVFSAGVEAVDLDVFVTSQGRAVTGLGAGDFDVRDNGVPQAPSLVDLRSVGLTATLVFDTSGSVAGEKLSRLRAAGHAFIDGLGEPDSASLLTFSEEVLLPVAATRDRAALHRALDRIGARGATAVRDALYVALRQPREGGRPMVVLFTDGEDVASWLTADDVVAAARQSDALVNVVASAERRDALAEYRPTVRQPDLVRQGQGLPPTASLGRVSRDDEESAHIRFLRQVAQTTGGALWTAASSDLPRVFRGILEATRTCYVLSYEPRGVPRTGRHRLKVSVKGRRVDVRARTEYVVPPR